MMNPYSEHEEALAEVNELIASGTLTWVELSLSYVKELSPDIRPNERWFQGVGSGWRVYLCDSILDSGLRKQSAYAVGVTWAGEVVSFLPVQPEQVNAALAQIKRLPAAKPPLAKIRILIVEDVPEECKAITEWLNCEPDFLVCGAVPTAELAMQAIATLKPDVVLTGVLMPGIDGIEFTKNVVARWPELPVLVLSFFPEELYGDRAIRAGAMGYVMKQEATESLVTAIRRIADGQIYISEETADKLLEPTSPEGLLSDRELEVLTLIGQGHGTRQIAAELSLSVKTIESHRAQIKEKLNLATGSELVFYAVQWVNWSE